MGLPIQTDQVFVALNTARTRLNDRLDTLEAVSGRVLDNSQAFTQQIVNSAWRRLQAELVKLQEWVRAERTRIVVVFEGRIVGRGYLELTGYGERLRIR